MDINVTAKTIKLFEENTRIYLNYLGLGNNFLGISPKAQVTKERSSKLDSIKMKKFVLSKTLSRKWKGNAQNGRKLFVNHMFDKDIVSKIYKEPLKLNETNNTI